MGGCEKIEGERVKHGTWATMAVIKARGETTSGEGTIFMAPHNLTQLNR